MYAARRGRGGAQVCGARGARQGALTSRRPAGVPPTGADRPLAGPLGQNHRQRTLCPSPRPSLPRFMAPPHHPCVRLAAGRSRMHNFAKVTVTTNFRGRCVSVNAATTRTRYVIATNPARGPPGGGPARWARCSRISWGILGRSRPSTLLMKRGTRYLLGRSQTLAYVPLNHQLPRFVALRSQSRPHSAVVCAACCR